MQSLTKQTTKLLAIVLFLGTVFTATSCKKDEEDSPSPSSSSGNEWAADVVVDLGGAFNVKADVTFDLKGSTFDATVKTTEIGGSPEEHTTSLSGTQDGNNLKVTNHMFSIINPSGNEEDITITEADIVLDGNNMTGSGTIEVDFKDGSQPLPGTFTITGTKK